MTSPRVLLIEIVVLLAACTGSAGARMSDEVAVGSGLSDQQPRFTAGKDYVVLERRRFLDTQGFDRPVEAFSVLCPKDWKGEGGVQWKGVGACRGEILSTAFKLSSPDGGIVFEQLPVRSFGYASDPMMMQAMQAGAQAGGCGINQPFTAEEYIQDFARQDLGATVADIVLDEDHMPMARRTDEQANGIARQYGNSSEQTTTFSKGRLSWPDGTQGIIEVGVTNIVNQQPDMMNGGMTMFSTTSVFYTVITRFSADRREEADRLRAMITSSHRVNPVWKQAKDDFLTRLGNIEHQGRMDRIRLMGEQARAYAQAQNEASDRRMRDWERDQATQDGQHERFVKTIREVETWNDGSNGRVELTSGYDHAWSRGDGSYILSNDPNFDPGAVLQDRSWQQMRMEK